MASGGLVALLLSGVAATLLFLGGGLALGGWPGSGDDESRSLRVPDAALEPTRRAESGRAADVLAAGALPSAADLLPAAGAAEIDRRGRERGGTSRGTAPGGDRASTLRRRERDVAPVQPAPAAVAVSAAVAPIVAVAPPPASVPVPSREGRGGRGRDDDAKPGHGRGRGPNGFAASNSDGAPQGVVADGDLDGRQARGHGRGGDGGNGRSAEGTRGNSGHG